MTKPKYSLWEAINLALTLGAKALEEIRALAREPGPAGKDGRDGKDAVGFDDFDEVQEDDGRFLLRQFYRDGQVVKEIRHQTKTPIWRGVWDETRTYLAGDEVTWRNSIWTATKEITGVIGSEHGWLMKQKRPREFKLEDVVRYMQERSS